MSLQFPVSVHVKVMGGDAAADEAGNVMSGVRPLGWKGGGPAGGPGATALELSGGSVKDELVPWAMQSNRATALGLSGGSVGGPGNVGIPPMVSYSGWSTLTRGTGHGLIVVWLK